MTRYIENINAYLSQMKIKQSYISMRSGIDQKKLSRILTGAQDISSADMEKLAAALGQKMEFFLKEPFALPKPESYLSDRIAFYGGNPTRRQQDIADSLLKLIENIDEVLSAKESFLNIAKGQSCAD